MRTGFVDAGDKETDTVWATAVVLRVDLGFVRNGVDDAGYRDRTVIQEAGGHGLLAHEV